MPLACPLQDAPDPVCGLHPLAGDRLSLYIELNVAFKLTVEDAGVVPQAEVKVRLLALPCAMDCSWCACNML
jgi:hypothetical protein